MRLAFWKAFTDGLWKMAQKTGPVNGFEPLQAVAQIAFCSIPGSNDAFPAKPFEIRFFFGGF